MSAAGALIVRMGSGSHSALSFPARARVYLDVLRVIPGVQLTGRVLSVLKHGPARCWETRSRVIGADGDRMIVIARTVVGSKPGSCTQLAGS